MATPQDSTQTMDVQIHRHAITVQKPFLTTVHACKMTIAASAVGTTAHAGDAQTLRPATTIRVQSSTTALVSWAEKI